MIVDAYHHSLALRNLRSFDAAFGIPNPTTENFVAVDGPALTTSGSGDVDGWGVETALDVQWAHAMAPGARIVLVQAATDDDANIAAALAESGIPSRKLAKEFPEVPVAAGLAVSAREKM